MFELYGLTYVLSKEINDHSKWNEEEERVVSNWPEKSGLKEQAKKNNIVFLWSFPEHLESHFNAGYEILYEIDQSKFTCKRFTLKDGSILVGKRTG